MSHIRYRLYIDSDLVMRTHVQRTVSSSFTALRQPRSTRRSVPISTMQTLVVSLVLSRLDYGNATLVGLPIYLQRRMESAFNSSARLIYDLRRSDHNIDAQASLHWLRVPERIKYKTALLAFHALYVTRCLNTCRRNWCVLTFHLVAVCGLFLRHSWWCHAIGYPLSAAVHFMLLDPQYGISYLNWGHLFVIFSWIQAKLKTRLFRSSYL